VSSSLALIQKIAALKKLRDKTQAAAKAQAERRVQLASPSTDPLNLPLLEYVPSVSKHLEAPHHLKPYADLLDRAAGSSLRIVLAAPPQHGKTVLTSHGLAKLAGRARFSSHFAYATFSQTRSDEVARDFRRLLLEAGLNPKGQLRKQELPRNNTHIKFTSIGGPLTGYPIDADGVLVVDDPFKDGAEARSKVIRDRVYSWFQEVAMTRVHPGASVIVMATRWHEDDLSGRLIKDGWQYLNLQALCEDPATDPLGRQEGEALWEEKRPRVFLEERRARDPWGFTALYQGRPRPRGGALFREPARFDRLPDGAYRCAYGIDLAYSARTQADWSVWVRMLRIGDQYFITEVCRRQVQAPEFLLALRAAQADKRGPMRWYAGGTEKGVADFIKKKIPQLKVMPATADKFQRAQPLAEAWNAGRVALPSEESEFYGEWVDLFVNEFLAFTGVNDPNDDQIDAGASAFDELVASYRTGSVIIADDDGGYRSI